MRVPDLDWPADLFTDVIGILPEATMVLYAAAPTRPTLWRDLLNAWTGNDRHPPAGVSRFGFVSGGLR